MGRVCLLVCSMLCFGIAEVEEVCRLCVVVVGLV